MTSRPITSVTVALSVGAIIAERSPLVANRDRLSGLTQRLFDDREPATEERGDGVAGEMHLDVLRALAELLFVHARDRITDLRRLRLIAMTKLLNVREFILPRASHSPILGATTCVGRLCGNAR